MALYFLMANRSVLESGKSTLILIAVCLASLGFYNFFGSSYYYHDPELEAFYPQFSDDLISTEVAISYYDVGSDSIEQVLQDLRTKGPVDEDGVRRYAYALWIVHWKWGKDENGKNDFSKTQLQAKVSIRLPRLSNEKDAPKEVLSRWTPFIKNLIDHEKHHAAGFWREVPRLARVLRSLPKETTPSAANLAGFKVIAEMRKFDSDYDQSTDHGKTEGVYFTFFSENAF